MKKREVMKEARNLKKIAKLGAVPMKDFKALKQDVQMQRIGFLALAGIEVIRLAKPKKGISKKDIDNIAEAVLDKIIDSTDGSEEYVEEVTPKKANASEKPVSSEKFDDTEKLDPVKEPEEE